MFPNMLEHNMPEDVARNAREIHTCAHGFQNSADDKLHLWKRWLERASEQKR